MKEQNKLQIIFDKYRENKMAHAYLIETNNQDKCVDDLLEILKMINCNDEYCSNCQKCNICNLINLNNLPTLKIIEPDGNFIKKQQIIELKENFSSKPVYTKYNMYIIKNAHQLNSSSSNTMLKFLEEPDGQVIGFFITNNKDNLLLTIQSRCQTIKAIYDENNETKDDMFYNENKIKIISEYLENIESGRKTVILQNKKVIISELLENIKLLDLFKYILDIYKEALYYKKGFREKYIYNDNFSYIIKNNEEIILKKISLIMEYIDDIHYNLNTELLLDRFVIEMSGIDG